MSDFRGMAGSGKQKAVLDATNLSRKSLSDLFPNQKPDKEVLSGLFWELHRETEPVKPEKLGIIGKNNLDCMPDIDDESFSYNCIEHQTTNLGSGVRISVRRETGKK